MKSSSAFQYVMGLLIAIVIIAASITLFVRPPSEAAGPRVVGDVETTGKLRLLIEECANSCRRAMELDASSPQEDYDITRAGLMAMNESMDRLLDKLTGASETWIPVDEAVLLVKEAQGLVQMTLEKTPVGPVSKAVTAAADVLETDKSQVGFADEAKEVIEGDLQRLENESLELRDKVERTVLMTSLSRESIGGFEMKYVLMALLLLSSTISCLTIQRASRSLSIPPDKSLESQLKLKARVNPTQAIEGCYNQSRKMLQVADEIFTKSKLVKPVAQSLPTSAEEGE